MSDELLQQIRTRVSGFTYNDHLRHLKSVEEASTGARPLRIAVLRSYTVEPIEPILKLRLLLEGFNPTFWFGGYGQYVTEILDAGSAFYAGQPDVVLLLTRIEDVLPDFVTAFESMSSSEWREHIGAKVAEFDGLLDRLEQNTQATVFVQNMALSGGSCFGIFDAQHADGQTYLVDEFNRALAEVLTKRQGAFVWDFAALVRSRGFDTLLDAKNWYTSRNPFKQSAYLEVAADLLRYLLSARGREKKCIVVDLDNTLWGGVVGEDGFDGIKLGHTYPGNCYRDFQRGLIALSNRGLLLAVNSKNNEADALRVIDEHPDMVLRREHFAAIRINWQDKAQNLRELARELNIGLDSLIFVDDNPVECELVRREIPECAVVQLPDKPYLLPTVPAALPGVEKIRLTPEDRVKREMYRAQAARRQDEAQYSNLEEFLTSLEIEVAIEPATTFSIPRIAQLTQKTNQMNMTTRRYTEAEVRAFVADQAWGVFAVSSKDRFGDNGIIGVLMVRHSPPECWIDTFLLSCRVIGRGIEHAMLAYAAEYAQARGANSLVADFLPTSKNAPAAGFYERAGLEKIDETRYSANLVTATLSYPSHLRLRGPVMDTGR